MVTRKAKSLNNKAKTDSKAANEPKHIGLVVNDGYLAPYEDAIRGRHDHALWKLGQLTRNGKISLEDFASGYDYYGLHNQEAGSLESGRLMRQKFILSAISIIGKRQKSIKPSV